ncbi:ribosomal protein L1/ribosomal biogenesis protein [Phycomyces nitens]|nr:ribosomal protein L1/ribosomal biogenesis protein [Phycomyces nitens]
MKSTFVTKEQVKKAVHAFYETYNVPEKPAYNPHLSLWLNVITKKANPKVSSKIKRLTLKHSVLDDTEKACLICKENEDEVAQFLKDNDEKRIAKVISVATLKSSYSSLASRQKLLSMFSLFLIDEQIFEQIPKLFGPTFFTEDKIAVSIKMKKLKGLRARISIIFGVCYVKLTKQVLQSAKIAHLGMSEDKAVDNVLCAVPGLVNLLQDGWKNIEMITLKTDRPPSLPLFINMPIQPEADKEDK